METEVRVSDDGLVAEPLRCRSLRLLARLDRRRRCVGVRDVVTKMPSFDDKDGFLIR